MTTHDETGAFPYRFVIVTFAVSIAVGVVVAYFGIHGQLGWGVP